MIIIFLFNVALGFVVFLAYPIVIAVWYAESKKNPYELVCSNCNAKTTGNLGTFLLRIHWGNKVLMTCPSCGELRWLTAVGKIRS